MSSIAKSIPADCTPSELMIPAGGILRLVLNDEGIDPADPYSQERVIAIVQREIARLT